MFTISYTSYCLENRLALIESLLPDLKKIKMFGISADFWKNKFTSDSYLTVNLHYNKDGKMKNLMLKTVSISEAKTDGKYTIYIDF